MRWRRYRTTAILIEYLTAAAAAVGDVSIAKVQLMTTPPTVVYVKIHSVAPLAARRRKAGVTVIQEYIYFDQTLLCVLWPTQGHFLQNLKSVYKSGKLCNCGDEDAVWNVNATDSGGGGGGGGSGGGGGGSDTMD
jgi:uncharacterized membrane protein YgcG